MDMPILVNWSVSSYRLMENLKFILDSKEIYSEIDFKTHLQISLEEIINLLEQANIQETENGILFIIKE